MFEMFSQVNLLTIFWFILGVQVAFFLFAALLKTDKVTDLSYGLSFVAAVVFLYLGSDLSIYYGLLVLIISFWGVRLAGYLFYRILKIKTDKRFDGIRENPLRFAGFWTLQAFSIWIILLPTSVVLISGRVVEIGWISVTGLVIAIIGLIIESVADQQKFVFKSNLDNRDGFISTGLWRYSRHPNYFGELLVWWGVFIYTLPVLVGWEWLSVIGPIQITILLLFVTGIPTIERKYDQKYKDDEGYQQYKKKTSLLLPRPAKPRG